MTPKMAPITQKGKRGRPGTAPKKKRMEAAMVRGRWSAPSCPITSLPRPEASLPLRVVRMAPPTLMSRLGMTVTRPSPTVRRV